MKTTLKISLLLNLGLTGVLIFHWTDRRKVPSAIVPPALSIQPATAIAVPASTTAPAPRVEPVPFNWSQLASSDYRTYVQNLRRIGCPEPTLHAIVTADVDTKYRQRSRELEKKLDDLSNGSWAVQLSSYQDQQALKLELEKLPAEETAEINNFLGLNLPTTETSQPAAVTMAVQPLSAGSSSGENPPSGNQVVAYGGVSNELANSQGVQSLSKTAAVGMAEQTGAFSQPLVAGQLPPMPKSASLPLVFQPVDQTALNLNEAQQQAVNNLRQDFINSVSSLSQNPTDPAYQQTWQQAQSQSDQMTLVQLGYNPYMQYWLAQYQKSLAVQVQSQQ
jgi:hypothetical protein